ncbi:MAG: hypothetical protein ACK47X_11280, partial [Akkermansiaceae bacterium]
ILKFLAGGGCFYPQTKILYWPGRLKPAPTAQKNLWQVAMGVSGFRLIYETSATYPILGAFDRHTHRHQ